MTFCGLPKADFTPLIMVLVRLDDLSWLLRGVEFCALLGPLIGYEFLESIFFYSDEATVEDEARVLLFLDCYITLLRALMAWLCLLCPLIEFS